MKKMMWLGALILSAASGVAQESRQDVSVSGTGLFGPFVHSPSNTTEQATGSLGILASYRFMLTPKSALEVNYSFTQDQQKYSVNQLYFYRIHSREQEMSAAYVFSLNFKNFSPFVEAGLGGMIFTPIHDYATTTLDTKQTTSPGGLFGGGVAYELSPSFDIRAEYRGFVTKTPAFGVSNLSTNKYELLSIPTIGVAYHF